MQAKEFEFSEDDLLSDWPCEIAEQGAISLHRAIYPAVHCAMHQYGQKNLTLKSSVSGDVIECIVKFHRATKALRS